MRKTKQRKTNKFIRYTKVLKRNLRRLNRKKVLDWFERNIPAHPFILGLLFFIWLSYIINLILDMPQTKDALKAVLKIDGIIFVLWLVLVITSNALRDKQEAKWYFRKRFVFFLMLLVYPLGLVFLWAGSRFKTKTKTVLTIIFGALFLTSIIYQEHTKKVLLNKSAFERIINIMNTPKKKIFLSSYPSLLNNLKLSRAEKKNRAKLATSEIYARYSPGIVSIKTKDKSGRQIGLGSGFIVSQDGFIVTNYHVLVSAYQAEVNMQGQVFTDVRLVKAVPQKDIAILKVQTEGIPYLVIGNSDELLSGEFVVSLGSPLGLEYSISSGIVSAIRSGKEIKLIQMTAPVSLGSSGSPVFNEYGEVIGITTLASFFFAQNVNFAVPINYLESIINQK